MPIRNLTEGDDVEIGSEGADTIFGLSGNDSITGEDGDDFLSGDDGADTLRGGYGHDTIEGGAGDDEIEGLYGNDVINAGAGDDHIFARDDDDLVYGEEGRDTLIGGIGTDTLFGGAGNDLLAGSQGDDIIHGGGGDDLVFIGILEGSDRMFLGDGKDFVDGITAGSAFYAEGGSGDDQITSGKGDDTLLGGTGDDRLEGTEGNDTLDGGEGTDTALYSGDQTSYTLTFSKNGTTITDRRADQNGTDTLIDLEFLSFETSISGSPLDLSVFDGATDLSATDLNSVVELYIAYFNRAPDASGLLFWAAAVAKGTSLQEAASLFIDQDETRETYPTSLTNADFATTVYANVLGRVADEEGYDFWVGQIDGGSVARDQFILEILAGAKADPQNGASQAFVDQQLADRDYLQNKTDIGAYFAVHKGMSDVDAATDAMAVFDGSQASHTAALSNIDDIFDAAHNAQTGTFLMPLVGILDIPTDSF